MKRFAIVSFILCLIPAACALAQADPDPDGIGFYADLDGWVNSADLDPGMPLQIYLLLTRCSASSGVSGWECTVNIAGPGTVLGWNLAGNGPLNIAVPPEFEVGLAVPTPWSPAILLMDVWLMVLSTEPVLLRIYGGPLDSLGNGLPVFAVGDNPNDLRNMFQSSGNKDLPVFAINGEVPIRMVAATWGEVKNLYR